LNLPELGNYLKIWIDILTPKQLLFSEPIVEKLSKNHKILCTSRNYGEITKLAKIRNFDLKIIGKHGGKDKKSKLEASLDRMSKLSEKIKKFSPDITISYCSPEAARVSFGLGIKHVAFCDSPHADAVMRLTLPLIQKLFIPNVIPKIEFSKYGIKKQDIIPYKSIDAAITIKRKIDESEKLPFKKNKRKNILIRMEEEHASYVLKTSKILSIIKNLIKDFENENIVILARYPNQIKNLQNKFGKKVKVVKMSFDGKHLLNNTDVFIGSGGTMTAESALLGIPTISYNAVPNIIENHLVKKRIVKRETNPDKITNYINKKFTTSKKEHKKRVKKIVSEMEDPIKKLVDELKR
jgi:predicted glycosyltransferase